MPARSPEEALRLVGAGLSAGDIDAVMALYEPGATFVPQPGQVATGTEQIRQAFMGFLALKPTMTIESVRVVASGDVALVLSKWGLRGTGPDGEAMTMAGHATDVARRQSDGTWKWIIDNPFGIA
jgi:uncharacterized protein (TIGR02246 family)